MHVWCYRACGRLRTRKPSEQGDRLLTETGKAGIVTFDTSGVVRLDTLGAWVLDRACAQMRTAGAKADFAGLSEAQSILLHEVAFHELTPPKVRKGSALVGIFADVGKSMCSAGRDVTGGVAFLGGLIAAAGRTIAQPRRFRPTSVVFQLEAVGFYSVPIIALISFLVGCDRRPAGRLPASLFRRRNLRRRSGRHPGTARNRRAAHRDHDRRPLGQRDHRRNRLDEDARGGRCAEGHRPQPDRRAGLSAAGGAGHRAAAA